MGRQNPGQQRCQFISPPSRPREFASLSSHSSPLKQLSQVVPTVGKEGERRPSTLPYTFMHLPSPAPPSQGHLSKTSFPYFLYQTSKQFFKGLLTMQKKKNHTHTCSLIYCWFWQAYVAFFFLINLFIYFWLRWVFVAAHGLSLVAASGGYSSLRCAGFSLWWLLLLWSTGSGCAGFSSCGSRAPWLWLVGSRAQAQ